MADLRALMRTRAALLAYVLAAAAPAAAGDLAVRVSPDRVTVAPGERTRFRAEAVTQSAREAAVEIAWEVVPPSLGRIDPDGWFTAGAGEGRGFVRASVTAGEDRGVGHALVFVGPGGAPALDVRVEPRSAETAPGGEVRFTAEVVDARSGETVAATIVWEVVPDGIGTIDGDGSFRAGDAPGSGRVAAMVAACARRGIGYAAVRVGPEGDRPPTDLRLTPRSVTAAPGEVTRFRVEGLSPEEEAAVTWIAVPRAVGEIAGGLFTAGDRPTEGRVVASLVTPAGVARGTAKVRVGGGASSPHVVVRPEEAVLRPGGEVRFTLHEAGAGGELTPVLWTVVPVTAGWITPDGTFHATGEVPDARRAARVIGEYRPGGNGPPEKNEARVLILAAPTAREIEVRPRNATVRPGETVRFEIEGADASTPVEWSVAPRTLGTITPDGVFTANEVFADAASREFTRQEGVVTARVLTGGVERTGAARVLVGDDGLPAEIVIEPHGWSADVGLADILGGRSIPFRARLSGPSTDIDVVVEWRLEPPGPFQVVPPVGARTVVTFAPATDLSSAAAGLPYSGRLVAERVLANGRRVGASVPVRLGIRVARVDLDVSPRAIDLRAGESVPLDVHASLATGTAVPLEQLRLTGTVTPKDLGTFDGGTLTFTAAKAGFGTIDLVASGVRLPLEGRAEIAVVVRPATSDGSGKR